MLGSLCGVQATELEYCSFLIDFNSLTLIFLPQTLSERHVWVDEEEKKNVEREKKRN